MIDYLIVGAGLAGVAFAQTALLDNKSIRVFDNNSHNSSKVAAGLYNPVILKRFSGIQDAQKQLNCMNDFYETIQVALGQNYNIAMPILRKFFSTEEQNNWFAASDKPATAPFLSTKILKNDYKGIDAPYGYGQVLQTGYVDAGTFVVDYQKYLYEQGFLQHSAFDYNQIEISPNCITYKNIQARHIVFAEGYGIHNNPYFKHLPLDGTKGELFIIKAENLELDVILNTSIFILPMGDQLFKVGATYNWFDKTENPTLEGKAELMERIDEILNCDYEIIEHLAGVRPTVKDRKPLLGTHPLYKNIHILNGLGTRGVMLGPQMAKVLLEHIETGTTLPREIDIKRFKI